VTDYWESFFFSYLYSRYSLYRVVEIAPNLETSLGLRSELRSDALPATTIDFFWDLNPQLAAHKLCILTIKPRPLPIGNISWLKFKMFILSIIRTRNCFFKTPVALPILLPTGITTGQTRLAGGELLTLWDGPLDSIPCVDLQGPYSVWHRGVHKSAMQMGFIFFLFGLCFEFLYGKSCHSHQILANMWVMTSTIYH